MATKKKVKNFTVNKRFTVWVSQEIAAANFDEAVEAGKELRIGDFIDFPDGTSHNDSEELPGFGVNENW